MSKANTRVIDLPEQNNPTGQESVYLATDTTDERISLDELKNYIGDDCLKKSENLANLSDMIEARNNIDVYSKSDVDGITNTLANKNHRHTTDEIDNFDTGTYGIIKEKIIAGENVSIIEEGEKLKISSTGGGSGGGGDMLKSVYDKDNDGVVDKAKVATTVESVDWERIQNNPINNYVTTNHLHNDKLTLKPLTITNLPNESASIFLESKVGQGRKYEFFSDNGGSFGVWDKTNNTDVLRLAPTETKFFRTLNANNLQIKNVANPTENGDAVNKQYLDAQILGSREGFHSMSNFVYVDGRLTQFVADGKTYTLTRTNNRISQIVEGTHTYTLNRDSRGRLVSVSYS